jgi:hypothetical protein
LESEIAESTTCSLTLVKLSVRTNGLSGKGVIYQSLKRQSVAWRRPTLFQRTVHCDATAQERRRNITGQVLWNRDDVCCGTKSVLLEGARGIESERPARESYSACAGETMHTAAAHARNPLDADSVAELETTGLVGLAYLGYCLETLAAADLALCCGCWEQLPL